MLHARPPKDVTKFNPHCLIGNWNEDRQLQRTLLKQLLANKATGSLKLDSYQQKLSVALRDVELTREADDGLVHFGDVLQLVHVDTGCVLADDVSDKDTRPGEEACAATAAPQIRSPCARNTFILLPYRPPRTAPLEPEYGDNVVRYGQKLRVAVYPEADGQPVDREAGPRPLCLFSKPVSVTHASKYSRKQLVGFTYRSTFDTVWQVVTPDPSQRSLSEGVEVMSGAPVLLVHCATQKPLAVEPQRYPNDFGIELELTARSATSHGLKLANEHAAQGIHKGFLPKGESSDNYWTFINGTKVATLPVPAAPSSEGARIVEALVRELSGGTLYDLERKLVLLEDGHCELPADELALVLKQVGSSITEDAIAVLTAAFAVQSRSRTIDARALLGTIRETRQRLALPV